MPSQHPFPGCSDVDEAVPEVLSPMHTRSAAYAKFKLASVTHSMASQSPVTEEDHSALPATPPRAQQHPKVASPSPVQRIMFGRLRSALNGQHLRQVTAEQIQQLADAFEEFSEDGTLPVARVPLPMKRLGCSSLAILKVTSELGLRTGLQGHVLVETFVDTIIPLSLIHI